jgi:hypothetical protein
MNVRPRVLSWAAAALFPLFASVSAAGAAQTPVAAGFELEEATVADIQIAFDKGSLTCRQLIDRYLARIDAYEDGGPRLNSITTINPRALDTADALDAERRRRGPRSPFHGARLGLVRDFFGGDPEIDVLASPASEREWAAAVRNVSRQASTDAPQRPACRLSCRTWP